MSVDLEGMLRDLAPRLFRYAIGRTGDASLAEDVVQDSLAALVARWQRHGPPDSPEAFTFAIARRRAARAALKRRLWQPLEAVLGSRDHRADPEALAIGRDARERVRAAIGRLSRRDREALLLVVGGGLSVARAADTLGISTTALKVRTFRARRRLAALLGSTDGIRL